MRYWLTSLLCMAMLATLVTCQGDDTTTEPDAEGAEKEGADDEQADTETNAEGEDNNTNQDPQNEGEPQDAATTQAPGDSASHTAVSIATCLSISLFHMLMM